MIDRLNGWVVLPPIGSFRSYGKFLLEVAVISINQHLYTPNYQCTSLFGLF